MADQKEVKRSVISNASEYEFGRGVLLNPFSITLWESPTNENGEVERDADKRPIGTSVTVQRYQNRLSKEEFVDEQARRTITFRIDLEGMPLSAMLEREASETTLRKQYRNNVWAANATPTLEEVEAMMKRAADAKAKGEPYVRISWKESQPKAAPKQDLSKKTEAELAERQRKLEAQIARLQAELASRK